MKLDTMLKKFGDGIMADVEKRLKTLHPKQTDRADKLRKDMLRTLNSGKRLESRIRKIEDTIESETVNLSDRIDEISGSLESLEGPGGLSKEELHDELGRLKSDLKERMRTFEEAVASKIMELSEGLQASAADNEELQKSMDSMEQSLGKTLQSVEGSMKSLAGDREKKQSL